MAMWGRRAVLRSVALIAGASATKQSLGRSPQNLKATVLADADLSGTLVKARDLLHSGLSAGIGYPEVWIRDLNTFIEFALATADPAAFWLALTNFLLLQGPDGDIVDGYVPKRKLQEPPYRTSPALPEYVAHKNTVESDQESSLVLAVARYVRLARDAAFLDEKVDGVAVRERLRRALTYPFTQRFDSTRGLVWGGATIDWGDVAPERMPGTRLFPTSHRAIGIYHNALLACAIREYIALPGTSKTESMHWRETLGSLKASVQQYLWDEVRQQYRPHVYLQGSPFPSTFDEAPIYLHGGTTVAIEADLLPRAQVHAALERMRANVRAAKASSIGLTIFPPYPEGFYADPILTKPFTYQNGGDWCWFGGRTVQQLVRFGMLEEAYAELKPMAARIMRSGDFYEWWTPDNQPRGSGSFRGAAGVLGLAIQQLQSAVARS